MKNIHFIVLYFTFFFFLSNCNSNHDEQAVNNISTDAKSIVTDSVLNAKKEHTFEKSKFEKLFQKKISINSKDSIISYKVLKVNDALCKNWTVPKITEMIKIIKSFYEISGTEWHDCYGDWSCGIEGEILFQSKRYYYRLDAGGWILLSNKNEQRYFGCRNPDCKKHFPSDCFCDENGIIDE